MNERLLSVAEARAIDRDAEQRLGMPTALLMENAARAVADVARTLGDRFVVFAGPGNNGGDGLAAARHLGWQRCALHLFAEPDPAKAPEAMMNPNYPEWFLPVSVPRNTTLSFKFIKKNGSTVTWEGGSDRSFTSSSSTIRTRFRNAATCLLL